MAGDLAQIKMLLWAILGLQLLWIASNVLCRVFGCGEKQHTNYGELLDRGKVQEVLEQTRKRLESHPRDVDALYFHSKALIAAGLVESARRHIERLMLVEPALISTCKEWLAALDADDGS